MSKIINYFRGAREELGKVVWPTRQTVTQHSLVVIGVSIAVALFLGLVDLILTKILELVF